MLVYIQGCTPLKVDSWVPFTLALIALVRHKHCKANNAKVDAQAFAFSNLKYVLVRTPTSSFPSIYFFSKFYPRIIKQLKEKKQHKKN